MQMMHTKGVTMCTFTPVTENRVIWNDFLYNDTVFPYLHDIFLNKLQLCTHGHS